MLEITIDHTNQLAKCKVIAAIKCILNNTSTHLLEASMAIVINLNKKRKAKIKSEKEKKASENRIKYGRSNKEKQLEKKNKERDERHLDGHKIE